MSMTWPWRSKSAALVGAALAAGVGVGLAAVADGVAAGGDEAGAWGVAEANGAGVLLPGRRVAAGETDAAPDDAGDGDGSEVADGWDCAASRTITPNRQATMTTPATTRPRLPGRGRR